MKKFKFRYLIDNDKFLWFFSFVFAISMWFMVISEVDTKSDKIVRNVPVTFNSQQGSLEKLGLDPVLKAPITVDVTINGERGVIAEVTAEDILVEPVLTGVSAPGEHALRITTSDKFNFGFDIVSTSVREVTVRFDRLITKELPVTVDVTGVTYPQDYMLGDEYVDVKTVTLSGPEGDLSQVYSCVAKAPVNRKLTKTEVVSTELLLLDKSGAVVDKEYIKMSAAAVDITIPVLKTKVLPLRISFINVPPDFPLDELKYSLSKEEIMVAGPESAIDSLSEINLGYIDFRDLDPGDYNFALQLPAGFVNVDGVEAVTVSFDDGNISEGMFNVSNIKLINKPANADVTVLTNVISWVKIYGDSSIISKLTAMDLVAEIDLSSRELKNGQTKMNVNISAPGKGLVWASGVYQAQINVKIK